MCKNPKNYINRFSIQAKYEGIQKLIILIGYVGKLSFEQLIFSFNFDFQFIHKKKLFSSQAYDLTFFPFTLSTHMGKALFKKN